MSNEAIVAKLSTTLLSSGWTGVIKPALMRLRDVSINTMLLPSNKQQVPADFSAGQLNVINWMISWDQRAETLATELATILNPPANPEEEGASPYSPDAPTAPIES